MSDETDVKSKAPQAAAPDTTEAPTREAIGQLMAQGKVPHKKPEAKAQHGAPIAGLAAHHEPVAASRGPSRARLLVLRSLLALNVVAMAALLLIPPAKPATSAQPQPITEPAHDTGMAPDRTRRPAYPDKDLYTKALQLGYEGKPVEAVTALEQYLSRNPALPKDQRRNIFLQMQYYNTAAGRTKEAEACLASAQQLLDRSFLPEDLLVAADLAAKSGNGAEMRRNYARFLLLQKTLPAALRERVAQAYLQLGDSYRIEAEQGELKAQTDAQARQRKLKDGQKGSEKPPGESGTPGKQAPQEHR